MKKCINCCTDIDENAAACSFCGVKQRKSIWSHQIITAFILIFSLSLIGYLSFINKPGSALKPEVSGAVTENIEMERLYNGSLGVIIKCDISREQVKSLTVGQTVSVTGTISARDPNILEFTGCSITF